MIKNVGGIDRLIRIVVGLVLTILAATGTLGPWAWLGLVVLGTGVVGHCIPYKWLGFNTCKITTNNTGK